MGIRGTLVGSSSGGDSSATDGTRVIAPWQTAGACPRATASVVIAGVGASVITSIVVGWCRRSGSTSADSYGGLAVEQLVRVVQQRIGGGHQFVELGER